MKVLGDVAGEYYWMSQRGKRTYGDWMSWFPLDDDDDDGQVQSLTLISGWFQLVWRKPLTWHKTFEWRKLENFNYFHFTCVLLHIRTSGIINISLNVTPKRVILNNIIHLSKDKILYCSLCLSISQRKVKIRWISSRQSGRDDSGPCASGWKNKVQIFLPAFLTSVLEIPIIDQGPWVLLKKGFWLTRARRCVFVMWQKWWACPRWLILGTRPRIEFSSGLEQVELSLLPRNDEKKDSVTAEAAAGIKSKSWEG